MAFVALALQNQSGFFQQVQLDFLLSGRVEQGRPAAGGVTELKIFDCFFCNSAFFKVSARVEAGLVSEKPVMKHPRGPVVRAENERLFVTRGRLPGGAGFRQFDMRAFSQDSDGFGEIDVFRLHDEREGVSSGAASEALKYLQIGIYDK